MRKESHSFSTCGLSLYNYCCLYHVYSTDPLWGSAGISHHAVGGSATSLSELLLLEKWAATAVPKLLTQVCHKASNQKTANIRLALLYSEFTLGFLFVCFIIICFIAYRKAVNYYELLGVKSNASLDEIKNAFFEKCKKVRPLFPGIRVTRGGQHSFILLLTLSVPWLAP